MGKHIFTKIKEEMLKMNKSNDLDYTETFIPYKEDCGFSVECKRAFDDLEDEEGTSLEYKGTVFAFEIYFQRIKNGVYDDVDCCSLSSFLDEETFISLKEFVDMWR